MISLLNSDDPLTENFIELISDVIKCDVYILDFKNKQIKPHNTGYDFIILNRRSVILLDIDHLYHLIYVKRDNIGQMIFDTNDPLITELRTSINK